MNRNVQKPVARTVCTFSMIVIHDATHNGHFRQKTRAWLILTEDSNEQKATRCPSYPFSGHSNSEYVFEILIGSFF